MKTEQRDAVLTICVLAATIDDAVDAERGEIVRIVEHLGEIGDGGEGATAMGAIYQRVTTGQVAIEHEAAKLDTPELRQIAYEMATAVCNADGAIYGRERAFLDRLQRALGMSEQAAAPIREDADAIAAGAGGLALAAGAGPQGVPMLAEGKGAAAEKEIDSMVRNYAILTGALELLPNTLATMAIIPIQAQMVYRIGKVHGYTLDSGHIKEFVGAAGIGMTGQILEGFATKLLGGFVRKIGRAVAGKMVGGMLGGAVSMATGPAITFATTYAIGMVAKQYYGGGRKLGAVDLRTLFSTQFESAKGLYERHAPEIATRASGLDVGQVMRMVRG